MSTLPQICRARSVTSVCVSSPISGSPIIVAATEKPDTKASGKPARSANLADSVSKTPGKAREPTSLRIRPTVVAMGHLPFAR